MVCEGCGPVQTGHTKGAPQIPRLTRISCRELRLRSVACGSLWREPHTWSPVRAVKQEIQFRSEVVTFYLLLQFAAGKLPRASAKKHRRGPSTPRHKALCCAICAKRFAQDDGFVGGLKYRWLVSRQHKGIEKGTTSPDDKGPGRRFHRKVVYRTVVPGVRLDNSRCNR